jgi:hypothetical protein
MGEAWSPNFNAENAENSQSSQRDSKQFISRLILRVKGRGSADSLTSGFLALRSTFARHGAFGGSLSSILLRMNAEVVP